jgi:hypothetical protein
MLLTEGRVPSAKRPTHQPALMLGLSPGPENGLLRNRRTESLIDRISCLLVSKAGVVGCIGVE